MPPVFKSLVRLEFTQLAALQKLRPLKDSAEWTLVIRCFSTADKVLATSESIVLAPDSSAGAKVLLSVPLEFSTWGDLDNIVHSPIAINFNEIEFIKDKKKPVPDEKSDLLGQVLLDLLPLVLGRTEIAPTLPVFVPKRDGADNQSGASAALGDEVTISVLAKLEKPLVPDEYQKSFNIVQIFIDGCYGMPPAWTGNASASSSFTIAGAMCTSSTHMRVLAVTNKSLQESVDSTAIRWPSQSCFVTESVYKGLHTFESQCALSDTDFQRRGPLLPSSVLFRCVLPFDAEDCFKARLMATKTWPLEIVNVTYPEKHLGVKPKKAADILPSAPEEPVLTKHGAAYVDLEPLLRPGMCEVSGSYAFRPFSLAEFSAKTGTKSAVYELYPGGNNVNTDSEKKTVTASSKKVGEHHSTLTLRKSMAPSATPSQEIVPQLNPRSQNDADLYLTHNSFVRVKVALLKPFVPKTVRTFSVEDRSLYLHSLPRRSGSEWPNDNGIAATKALQEDVKNIKDYLAALYQQHPTENWSEYYRAALQTTDKSEPMVLLHRTLYDHILRFVRDRFYRIKPFKDRSEYERYVRTVYASLAREVSDALKGQSMQRTEISQTKSSPEARANLRTDTDLKVLSMQEDLDGNFSKAEHFLGLRVISKGGSASAWKDIGMFQLRFRKLDQAVQSFSRWLSKEELNPDALLVLGYAFCELGKLNWAQTIFECVASLCPKNPLPATILGLFYEHLASDHSSEVYTFLMEKSYHEGRIALGLHGAVLEAADNSLRQRRISVGCELETMPKGDAAVAECRRLLVNLIDSRESALEYTNRESEPHEKTETESLFSPVTGCQTYQEDMRSLINSTNMQFATNIFCWLMPHERDIILDMQYTEFLGSPEVRSCRNPFNRT
ncbi:cilia- and flagella-associated protein 70-like isoform X2 [Paramacrobiotus metropolitanus]|uniref:cilia- and flagella-associated protein 70-like isoform X2 n=1 Tax=Paramacrobiotus metropolitanus TaxID=2943436 RepID=UPI002445C789|nr:cilia- and flagella-associated protein 70-like isoform X2 [Paramacrobiotus metropolitanus]